MESQSTNESVADKVALPSEVQPSQLHRSNLPINQTSEYELDTAKPIDPSTFPNRQQGWQKTFPATIPNIAYILCHYQITVRYDCIKKKLRISIPGHTGTSDNADNTAIVVISSLVTLNGIATGPVLGIVEAIGDRNLYNPVAEWIGSRPWDGLNRLPAVYETLKQRDGFPPELKEILIYKWLLSATAAAILPKGFKARGVLTFQGPQGIGKTSWVTALVTDPVLREMVTCRFECGNMPALRHRSGFARACNHVGD